MWLEQICSTRFPNGTFLRRHYLILNQKENVARSVFYSNTIYVLNVLRIKLKHRLIFYSTVNINQSMYIFFISHIVPYWFFIFLERKK